MSTEYMCVVCDKKLVKRTSLEYHMNIHKGFCPFKCQQCDKMFYTKSGLQKHNSKVHRKFHALDLVATPVEKKNGQSCTGYAGHDFPLQENFGFGHDTTQSDFNKCYSNEDLSGNHPNSRFKGNDSRNDFSGTNSLRKFSGYDSMRDFKGNLTQSGFSGNDSLGKFNENDSKRNFIGDNPKTEFVSENQKSKFSGNVSKRNFSGNDSNRYFSGSDSKKDFSEYYNPPEKNITGNDTQSEGKFKMLLTLVQGSSNRHDSQRRAALKEERFKGNETQTQEYVTERDTSTQGNLKEHDKPKQKQIDGCEAQSKGKLRERVTPLQANSNDNRRGKLNISDTSQKTFKCGECGRNYHVKRSLMRHMKVHVGKESVDTDECKSHLGFSEPRPLVKEDGVQNNLNVIKSLLNGNTEENPTIWSCDICDTPFPSKCERRTHYRAHFTNTHTMFSCKQCGKKYMHRWSVTRHEKRVHLKQVSLSGVQSDETPSKKGKMSRCKIFTRFHKKILKCKQCGKVYGLQKDLHAHQKMHRTPFFYQCGLCLKSFSSVSSLNGHFSAHRGRKKNSLDWAQHRRKKNFDHMQATQCKTNPVVIDAD